MQIIRTLLILTAVIALVACSKLTESNLEKVQNGMTTDQVKAILGEPTDSQTKSLPILGSSTVYTYHTDTSNVVITFLNDKVVTTEGDFK